MSPVATGIADAVAAARAAAGGRDVGLMGSVVIRAALDAGLQIGSSRLETITK